MTNIEKIDADISRTKQYLKIYSQKLNDLMKKKQSAQLNQIAKTANEMNYSFEELLEMMRNNGSKNNVPE